MSGAVMYFLADVHLSPTRPDITAAFIRTLTALSRDGSAVFILGDLFDYWLGDELSSDFQAEIATHLAALPCAVYFQHGNRDFLLGESFAARANMTLLPERYVIHLGGLSVLLEHGDLLCTDDRGYQRLRAVVRHRVTRWLFTHLPKKIKLAIAEKLRAKSKQAQAKKAAYVIDTNRTEIAHVLSANGAEVLIHGHTHRANAYFVDQKRVFVLGDYRPQGKMLRYENGQFALLITP